MPQEPLVPDDDARRVAALAKVGMTLRGKWHLDALIALGGMSAVYQGTHRNGMRGAVKILDAHLAASIASAARKRFLREGRLANRVNHPGAVRVLDDDETPEGAYLVMELLTGCTLDALAARTGGKLAPAKAVEYGLQIADTLAEAHASGIVHRDIKPENLFLTNEGIVKVLDFGIAGMVVADGMATLTRSGDPVGTPAFMAPEQARGRWELVDCQSDIYSLGSSLYTLLTGQLVNEAATVAEMLVLAMKRSSPSLRAAMPDAPAALIRAIDGALGLEKSKRWPNADAMRAALEEAYLALTRRRPPPRIVSHAPENEIAPPVTGVRRVVEATRELRNMPRSRWVVSVALVGIATVALAAAIVPRTTIPATKKPVATAAPPAPSFVASTAPPPVVARPIPPPPNRHYDPIYDQRR